jgi:SM-20-related protein
MTANNIIHKTHSFDNYTIETIDNVFTLDERLQMYNYYRNSSFKIGWEDTTEIEYANYKYMHSIFENAEVDASGFTSGLLKSELGISIISKYNVKRCVLNLSKPGDFYLNHTHQEDKVLLYYGNIRWKEEWSGETLFYDDSLQNILFATPYIPGRLILFDGKMPHTIRSQSSIAPFYRFTFTIFLTEK